MLWKRLILFQVSRFPTFQSIEFSGHQKLSVEQENGMPWNKIIRNVPKITAPIPMRLTDVILICYVGIYLFGMCIACQQYLKDMWHKVLKFKTYTSFLRNILKIVKSSMNQKPDSIFLTCLKTSKYSENIFHIYLLMITLIYTSKILSL